MPPWFRRQKRRLGLALSGGGARGLAHIGVLKVLEREGVSIHCLSGASMGGIIAAAYACGTSVEELELEAIKMGTLRELARLVNIRPPHRGLLAVENVRTYLAQLIPDGITFEQLRIPMALKAVDLHRGIEVGLSDGLVLDAVLATSAFPGVFPPFMRGDMQLVDGGVLNNLPVDLLHNLGAEVTLAINVSPSFGGDESDPSYSPLRLPNFAMDVYRSVLLMTRILSMRRLQDQPPDVLIEPEFPISIGFFSGFTHVHEAIAVGERAAEAELGEIRRLVR
ncbi:MAG: patatin-like phospholipase family protein [Anaerolineales bacterium]|nr:MAG: patatin-like phospholipase family protein [Anaerolineales bacterium]